MTDEELMLAYANGTEAALRELFKRYAPVLLRILVRQVRRPADAQDLTQQTFLQLHRARRDFRANSPFRPWIVTIALNLARDFLRRRGRRPECVMREEALPMSVAVQPVVDRQSDGGTRIRTAIHSLPKEQREVIELHWFEQLSFTEIASIVGASSGAARVRAHRGYVALRRSLDPGGTGFPQDL